MSRSARAGAEQAGEGADVGQGLEPLDGGQKRLRPLGGQRAGRAVAELHEELGTTDFDVVAVGVDGVGGDSRGPLAAGMKLSR